VRELLNTLYVQTDHTVLHLDGDAVLARHEMEPPRRAPLLRLEAIVLIGHVSVTTPLIHRCAADGRSIVWMTNSGRYAGRLVGPTSGNVLLRRAQWSVHRDPDGRLELARTIVAGKIQNSIRLGRNLARMAQDPAVSATIKCNTEAIVGSLGDVVSAGGLDEVRGIEGQVSRVSFDSLRKALLDDIDFGSRSRRPPRDPVNTLLSFLYALARTRVEAACEAVGLDPQVGYLHSVRPGRPALALDLVEETRPDIERLVVTLCNRRQVTKHHFEAGPGGAYQLTDKGRRVVLAAWYDRLSRNVRHRVLRTDCPWGLVPSIQATLLARHLRGDLAQYVPYVSRME
jgi:CRISPR-associated protein Cas1